MNPGRVLYTVASHWGWRPALSCCALDTGTGNQQLRGESGYRARAPKTASPTMANSTGAIVASPSAPRCQTPTAVVMRRVVVEDLLTYARHAGAGAPARVSEVYAAELRLSGASSSFSFAGFWR